MTHDTWHHMLACTNFVPLIRHIDINHTNIHKNTYHPHLLSYFIRCSCFPSFPFLSLPWLGRCRCSRASYPVPCRCTRELAISWTFSRTPPLLCWPTVCLRRIWVLCCCTCRSTKTHTTSTSSTSSGISRLLLIAWPSCLMPIRTACVECVTLRRAIEVGNCKCSRIYVTLNKYLIILNEYVI